MVGYVPKRVGGVVPAPMGRLAQRLLLYQSHASILFTSSRLRTI